MRYVDAGYVIGLGGVVLYAVTLAVRRRRLERAATVAERDAASATHATDG